MLTLSWAAREFSSVSAATRDISPFELDEAGGPVATDSRPLRL